MGKGREALPSKRNETCVLFASTEFPKLNNRGGGGGGGCV
eukprot:COSAG01_NODE_26610_length_708_cov_1.311987_1_plen_39_part_01